MDNLDKIYGKSFFSRRHKLNWRVPIVCDAIINSINPKSVLDLGCGCGEYVQGFLDRGVDSIGIEGSIACLPYLATSTCQIIIRDLREPITCTRKFGLVMCFEVMEHIEEEYVDTLLENITKFSNKILISAAPPGQGGIHHVNCQIPEYWVKKFFCRGYVLDGLTLEKIKKQFTHLHRKEIRVYYNNLLYFEKL